MRFATCWWLVHARYYYYLPVYHISFCFACSLQAKFFVLNADFSNTNKNNGQYMCIWWNSQPFSISATWDQLFCLFIYIIIISRGRQGDNDLFDLIVIIMRWRLVSPHYYIYKTYSMVTHRFVSYIRPGNR